MTHSGRGDFYFNHRKPYIIPLIRNNMNKQFTFIYDNFSDRLFISCKQSSDKVYGSVRLLNLTLDFTTDNKVVNIELRGASKYLESLGINPEILHKLTSAEIVFKQQRDGYLIYFVLRAGEKIERIPYNILTEKPILS